jgi:hypothetical protein
MGAEALANQFKRGDSVRFKTVGAGVVASRKWWKSGVA